MSSIQRAASIIATVVVVILAAVGTACEPRVGCDVDGDCSSGFCVDDTCVACKETADCGTDGGSCCRGQCVTGDVEATCGCDAAPGGDAGEACSDGTLCIVGGARASAANVDDGICECPCNPGRGGTLCAASVDAEGGFACSCDRTDPISTCEAASLDDAGIPHRPADTCSPDSTCVCFAASRVCGPTEDCTSSGCVSLVENDSCGVAERSCGEGACIAGGCECAVPADCRGPGLNVDTCGFDAAETLRCLCDGYTNDGAPAACPMDLECVAAGCVFDGTPYATREALVSAIAAR